MLTALVDLGRQDRQAFHAPNEDLDQAFTEAKAKFGLGSSWFPHNPASDLRYFLTDQIEFRFLTSFYATCDVGGHDPGVRFRAIKIYDHNFHGKDAQYIGRTKEILYLANEGITMYDHQIVGFDKDYEKLLATRSIEKYVSTDPIATQLTPLNELLIGAFMPTETSWLCKEHSAQTYKASELHKRIVSEITIRSDPAKSGGIGYKLGLDLNLDLVIIKPICNYPNKIPDSVYTARDLIIA